MDKDKGEDYYAVLGLEFGATERQISKAYKLMARKLHPDKNPDDPLAGQRFHALQQAYTVLSDPEARAAFDALIQARLQRKRKLSTMDAQRRNLKQSLEERENAAKRQRAEELDAQRRLAARMARLKEEAALKIQEEKDRRRYTSSSSSSSHAEVTVRIKWGRKGEEQPSDEAGLRATLARAGCPSPLALAVGRHGGALATFASRAEAEAALARLPYPLTGSLPDDRSASASASSFSSSSASAPPPPPPSSSASSPSPSAGAGLGHIDFENQVLARMAAAAATMRQQKASSPTAAPPASDASLNA